MQPSKGRKLAPSIRDLLVVFALLLTGGFAQRLCAQIDVGKVSGTVKDPAGAVVPDARLTLTNEATGVAQRTRASASGTYVFTSVLPGVYTLQAEATGFKTYVAKGIEAHVQNTLTADISLVVGEVTESVTVTSAAPLLQAQEASVGRTVGSVEVNALPLNGRNWLQLAQLQAGSYFYGSTSNVATTAQTSGVSIVANGAETGQVDFRLNGVNNNEEVFGGVTVSPIPDAVQEFKLQANDNSAEFGHSAGAVVNAVLRSGTNQIRGDVFEFNRNEAYNANDFFSNAHGTKRPAYRQNQFGGMVGGPVYIPAHYDGRDKTFFFFDFQRTQAVAADSFTDTIPTSGMRNSGFTNLQDLIAGNNGTASDALGRKFPLGTVFDPATTRGLVGGATDPVTGLTNTKSSTIYVRDPFYTGNLAGVTDFTGPALQLNLIPSSRIDPQALKILQLLPAPTVSGLRNNYFVNRPKNTTVNQYDLRMDHMIGAKDTLFGTFSRSTLTTTNAQPFDGPAGGALQIDFATTQPVYVLAVSETHTFSPTWINEARVGIDHNYNTRVPSTSYTLGLPAQYGIQGIPQLPGNGGLPTFNISVFNAFGGRRFMPTIQTTGAEDYTDNLTLVRGAHEWKTGVQFDRLVGDIVQPAYSKGNFTWNGQYADIPNQNSNLVGLADFLLIPTASSVSGYSGLLSTYNYLGGPSSYDGSNYAGTNYSASYLGLYVQDNWKVTSVLTLNLGLRWEYFGPYSEDNGRQGNFLLTGGNGPSGTFYIPRKGCDVPRSPGFNSLLSGSNVQVACVSSLQVNQAQKTNFSPRLGFAYRLRPRLVIRGGYAIAYGAFDSVGYGSTLGTNYPFQYTVSSPSTTSLLPITLANGQPATLFNTFSTIDLQDPTQINGQNLSLSGKQYHYATPYTESINFTAQYQFTDRDAFQVGYVGTLGRHLDVFGNQNAPTVILPPGVNPATYRPFPNFAGNSQYLTSIGTSKYHSLQATYEHRFTGGLGASANYTYGKCISDDYGKGSLATGSRGALWLPGWGLANDRALCPSDATHLLHVIGEYALPFGKGHGLLGHTSKLVDAIIGGWQFNYIYIYQSGQPFNVGCPTATTSDFGCYAFLVPGRDPYAGPHDHTQWLNPYAFDQPPAATQIGQSDYSVLGGQPEQVRGPSFSNLDSSLFKKFATSERTSLEFRLEVFNTFNTPEFGNPGQLNFKNLSNFSQITNLRNIPRVGQLALKFYF